MNIDLRNPTTLKVHPAVAGLPSLADDDIAFRALVADVMEHGWLPGQEVLITADGRIIDGRHRWRVAKRLQLDLPCVVFPGDPTDAEVIGIALKTLTNRRHYTKGQQALLAWPLVKVMVQAARKLQTAGLKKGSFPVANSVGDGRNIGISANFTPDSVQKPVQPTVASICLGLGISDEYMHKAEAVWTYWDQYPDMTFTFQPETLVGLGLDPEEMHTLRAVFEPQLMRLNKPMGLGAACAGMGSVVAMAQMAERGRDHGGGRPDPSKAPTAAAAAKAALRQADLFRELVGLEDTRWSYWQAMPEEKKAEVWVSARKVAEALSPDQAKERAAYHLKLSRIFDAKAKGE